MIGQLVLHASSLVVKHGSTFGAKPWAPNALQFEKLEAFSAALMSTAYSDV
jgi:hypothetical protein